MAGLHELAKTSGLQDEQVGKVFEAILEHVKKGDRVLIHNFGSFFSKTMAARTIVSPQIPGGRAEVPEREVLRFHPADQAKKALNSDAKAAGTPAPAKNVVKAAVKKAAPAPVEEPEAEETEEAEATPAPAPATPKPAAKVAPKPVAKAAAPVKPAAPVKAAPAKAVAVAKPVAKKVTPPPPPAEPEVEEFTGDDEGEAPQE